MDLIRVVSTRASSLLLERQGLFDTVVRALTRLKKKEVKDPGLSHHRGSDPPPLKLRCGKTTTCRRSRARPIEQAGRVAPLLVVRRQLAGDVFSDHVASNDPIGRGGNVGKKKGAR